MRKTPWVARLQQSLNASAGDVVFGMEDGAVSIFGLVFGVAATTDQNAVVLVAGITGAFAAAVSMMAGVFLDRESEQDQVRVRTSEIIAAVQANPGQTAGDMLARLTATGMDSTTAAAIVDVVRKQPAALQSMATALALPAPEANQQSPLGHALWMLVADLFASLLPVLPFAFLSIDAARVASVILTALLMIGVGVWRARLGRRRTLSTALQTLAIAAAAGIVGLLAGQIVDRWFGQ